MRKHEQQTSRLKNPSAIEVISKLKWLISYDICMFGHILLFLLLFSTLTADTRQENQLLINGDFEKFSTSRIPENWSSRPKKSQQLIEGTDKNNYVRLTNSTHADSSQIIYKDHIAIPPDTDSVIVKGKVNVKEISPGEESWHDARIALTFKNENGKAVGSEAIYWKKPTAGWIEFEKKFNIKKNAVQLGISMSIFHAKATVEFDNLELYLVQVPKDKISWNLDDAYQIHTATRTEISLNGIWKVKLIEKLNSSTEASEARSSSQLLEKNNKLNKVEWSLLRVPGEWYSSNWMHYTRSECLLPVEGDQGPRDGICREKQWNGKALKDYFCAWYEREFIIPRDWKVEDTYLRFEDFNLAAWIYVNSQRVAIQSGNDASAIRLPKGLKSGDKITINVLVNAEVDGIEQMVMGGGESYIIRRKKESNSRGIIGDVWLINQPQERIENVLVQPSVREKQLDIKLRLSELQKNSDLKAEMEIYRHDNSELVKKHTLDLVKSSAQSNQFKLSLPWENPVLWSPSNPFLYMLKLRITDKSGKILDEYAPIRFGFREFWIEGGDYYLNGNIAHLRSFPASSSPKEYSKALFNEYKKVGYNTVYLWPVLQTRPIMEAADEVGFFVVFKLPPVHEYLKTWETMGRDRWIKDTTPFVERFGNHPSLIHWSMNRNMLGYAFDMLPELIGIEDSRSFGRSGEMVMESEKIVNDLDGSRPIVHHACGSIGQVHSSNIYLNFAPDQEKQGWLLNYFSKRIKPFYAVELGMPYLKNYYYGRKGFGEVAYTEPLHCEYAAMFLGEQAYADPDPKVMDRLIKAKVVPKASNGADRYTPSIKIETTDVYLKTQRELSSFLKNWRACGVGGLNPWATKLWSSTGDAAQLAIYKNLKTPGIKTRFSYLPEFKNRNIMYDAIKKYLAPLLVYIGGPSDEFTVKRGNYISGETIVKSIICVNDTPVDILLPIKITLFTNGELIEEKIIEVNASIGETKILDFSLIAPEVKDKQSAVIRIESLKPEFAVNDSIDLQIFPTSIDASFPSPQRKIYLIDKTQDTAKVLKSMNLEFIPYNGRILGSKDLLVIGRFSIAKVTNFSENIKKSLHAGTNILVFEQTAEDLKHYLGFRTFQTSSRKVFMGYGSMDILDGMSDNDFIDWSGKSTAILEYPTPKDQSYPVHIWKQGNSGVVSAVTIEKPHYGSFRSVLHEGFNLNYTPLLLEFIGKGQILYCQLDITSRTRTEPAAMIVLEKIITYMDSSSQHIQRSVVFTGSPQGADILNWLGIVFRKSDQAGANELWIVDNAVTDKPREFFQQLKTFVVNGGDLVVLNMDSPAEIAEKLGAKLEDHSMEGYFFEQKKSDASSKGLTAADWYWKDNISLKLPTPNHPLLKLDVGKGTIVFCQVNPFYFKEKQMLQRRYASRIKMFKVLAHLLTSSRAANTHNSCDYLKGAPQTCIDLAGRWSFILDPDNAGEKMGWQKKLATGKTISINVPGYWEKQQVNDYNPNFKHSSMPYDGYAWYQKELKIEEQFKGNDMYLKIGAIDDFDWIYFNGTLVGKTGRETKGWYAAERLYRIPAKLINYGKNNLISIKVLDEKGDGGIASGPVVLYIKKAKEDFPYLDTSENSRHDPYLFQRW